MSNQFDGSFYDENYFQNGKKSGKGWLENYHFMPQRSIREALGFIDYLGLDKNSKVLDFGCFCAGTKITKEDYKDVPIEDIEVGDVVITHLGNKKRVLFKSKRIAEILKLKSLYSFEWNTTSEHPFLIERNGVVDFVPAESVREGDFFAIPIMNNEEENYDENLLAEFLGFYLAEGNMMWCHGVNSTFAGIRFTFGLHEPEYASRIEFLGNHFGATSITINKRMNKNIIDVMVFGQKLANRIYNLGGKYSHEKEILLSEIMLWSNNAKKILISSWLKGDGHLHLSNGSGTFYAGYTVSKKMAEDIRKICFSIGLVPSLSIGEQKNRKTRYTISFHGTDINELLCEKIVNYTSRKRYKRNKEYVFIPFIGKEILDKDFVYNMEVEEDHTYYANGVPVHNCAYGFLVRAFRILEIDAMGCDISEHALFNSPYGCWNCSEEREWKNHEGSRYTHVVCKDVLEHLTPEQLHETMIKISKLAKKMMVVIPMGDNGVYRIPEYHLEISHLIAEDELWWQNAFENAGWKIVKHTHHVDGIKDNWMYCWNGNHVFVLEHND